MTPAPTPLAAQPTAAFGCTGIHFPAAAMLGACAKGRAPVLMHRLAGEDGSNDEGPREMLATTMQRLGETGHAGAWGAGCVVRSSAEAAAFATAGFTWFSFDLGGHLDTRADTMSPDELDAAVVRAEDAGFFPLGWHELYLDCTWQPARGDAFRIEDERLARFAVKYGRALAEAAQWQQAVRTLWSGRGSEPDIELNFAGRRERWSPAEFFFVAHDAARRGLGPACISPSLGHHWQPGADFSGDAPELSNWLSLAGDIAALAGQARVGIRHAAGKSCMESLAETALGSRCHANFEEDAWLATLEAIASGQPDVFRRWLVAAQEQFPFAAGELPLAITEEEIHALPQVDDASLAATFLQDLRGRQLLLATFADVLRSDRSLREAVSGGSVRN